MFSFLFTIILLCIALASGDITTNTNKTCEIPIASKSHYRYQWPLVFKPNSDDFYPTTTKTIDGIDETQVHIKSNEEVWLSCAPNYLRPFQNQKQEQLLVRCNGATGNLTVLPSEIDYSVTKLTCDLRVIEEVLTAVPGCSNNFWTATAFGYVEPKAQLTSLVGEACYDANKGVTRFAHVKLGAQSFLRKEPNKFLTKNSHPDGRYKIELFRNLHFDEIYARLRESLQQKHVPQMKLTQYIDEELLSTPQLNAVKKLGWNYFVAYEELNTLSALKKDIQQLSTKAALDVYVGSHGVKTLTSASGVHIPIYISEQRFPVPAHIWFLVQHENNAVVFVVSNTDNNSIDTDSTKPLCRSDCGKVTWLNNSSNMPGLLCCSIENAQQNIPEIPLLDIEDTLF